MARVPVIMSLAALAVVGCAGVQTLMGDAELRPMGSGLYVLLPGDSPPGVYVLETKGGMPVGRGMLAGTRQGQRVSSGTRLPMPINVNVHQSPEARGCLRIRRPDSRLVAYGMSGQTDFQLPALEAAHIQVEIRELQQAERDHARNLQIVSNARQWFASSPAELTPARACRVPVASSSACRSEAAAIEAARKPCFEGNFACSMAGATVDSLISQLGDNKQSAATMANYLSANACSLAVDASYGQQPDLMTYLRSIGVTLAVDTLYRALVNENPGIGETYALAATAGVINYGLCLRDAAAQCREDNRRWAQYAQGQYRGCVARLSQYQRASDLVEKHGTPASIQRELQAKQSRLRELTSASFLQRTPLVSQVRSCS